MKKILVFLALAVLAIASPSCKSEPKDADIKAAAEKTLAADPNCAGITVTVNDGVATLTGECKDDATRSMAQTAVAGVKGVKSVQNNTTVYVPPVVVPSANEMQAAALSKAVADAVKDYPGVVATVDNQVVTLKGEIPRANLQKLMISLNDLRPMGLKSIDSKGLIKK